MTPTVLDELGHLADDFFRARRRRGMMAPETERSYGGAYLDFGRFLEGRGVGSLAAINRDLITAWQEGMAVRGNKASTQSLRGTALRRLLEWAELERPSLLGVLGLASAKRVPS